MALALLAIIGLPMAVWCSMLAQKQAVAAARGRRTGLTKVLRCWAVICLRFVAVMFTHWQDRIRKPLNLSYVDFSPVSICDIEMINHTLDGNSEDPSFYIKGGQPPELAGAFCNKTDEPLVWGKRLSA